MWPVPDPCRQDSEPKTSTCNRPMCTPSRKGPGSMHLGRNSQPFHHEMMSRQCHDISARRGRFCLRALRVWAERLNLIRVQATTVPGTTGAESKGFAREPFSGVTDDPVLQISSFRALQGCFSFMSFVGPMSEDCHGHMVCPSRCMFFHCNRRRAATSYPVGPRTFACSKAACSYGALHEEQHAGAVSDARAPAFPTS